MSNCDFVAPRSPIDLVASRLAHRALAQRAVSALTRPNQSVQRLPRQLTMKEVVGPHDVITNHGIKHGDHLAHDCNVHDLVQLTSYLRNPSLLMRARAQATVRVWKKELHAHSRFTIQDGCGLPVATGALS